MDSFELTYTFPVSSKLLYEAWLDGAKHSSFTGGIAAIEDKAGSWFTAWGGYITGKIIELDPNAKILMTWRTTEFATEDEDSVVEVKLEDITGGCQLDLLHTNIPVGQGEQYESGWTEHYFEPMERYFSSLN